MPYLGITNITIHKRVKRILLTLLHLLLDLTRTNYNLTTNGIFRFDQLDLTASAKETHLDSPRKE